MGCFLELCPGTDKQHAELCNHLLRAQIAAADGFFEKLRPTSSISWAKSHLPEFLRIETYEEKKTEMGWFLNCEDS